MIPKKILLINGHPDTESFNFQLQQHIKKVQLLTVMKSEKLSLET